MRKGKIPPIYSPLSRSDEATDPDEGFLRALLDAGLIRTIKRPNALPDQDRPLITISGEPISETIIRERR